MSIMDISIVVLSTFIHLSFGLRGNTCEINGMTKCCYNHEEVNGVCLQCKVGTVALEGSSCRPCVNNTYGSKCIGRCNCKHQERCDPVRGCIFWIASTTSTLYEENETTKDSTDRVETRKVTTANVISKREWIVYSLCIGTVILLGLRHLVRRYRKLKCTTETNVRADVEIQHDNEIERESQSIYNEIDDTLITENAVTVVGTNILSNTNSLQTQGQNGSETDHSESESGDNDGYLHPCISTLNSIKDDTDVYLIPCISAQDSIKDDTDGYLELLPCISAQDSIKDDASSYSVSSTGSSSDSNVKFDPFCNADYLNPYQTLNYDNRPTSMHNYETSVIVHAVDCPLTFYDKTNTQLECHEREEDMSTDIKSEEAEEAYNDEMIAQ